MKIRTAESIKELTVTLDISDEVWRARINQRNQAVIAGKTTAYIVDSALAAKFEAVFEPPGIEEADVWVNG